MVIPNCSLLKVGRMPSSLHLSMSMDNGSSSGGRICSTTVSTSGGVLGCLQDVHVQSEMVTLDPYLRGVIDENNYGRM